MAVLLISSSLQTLKRVIDSTPDFMFASRDKVKQLYNDLQDIQKVLVEADSVPEYLGIEGAARDLCENITAFEYNTVKNSSSLKRIFTNPLFRVFHNRVDRSQRSKIQLLDKSISLLRKKVAILRLTRGVSFDNGRLDLIDESLANGFDLNIKELVSRLVSSGDDGSSLTSTTVFVYGFGGSGKTTLARMVFKNHKVQDHFEYLAWVDVSDKARQVPRVQEEILVQLNSPDLNYRKLKSMGDDEVSQVLLEELNRKRYLVILDDVWNLDLVPEHQTRSRILVTTCTTHGRKLLERKGCYTFLLESLNQEEAWELLKRRVQFHELLPTDCEKDDTEKIKLLGQRIVEYCQGLPLAIVALSGLLLSSRLNVMEWDKILESLTRQRVENGDESGLSRVLNVSYNELPSQLKQCFLHLAHFPENREIKAKELVQMWIAEGFIQASESEGYQSLGKLIRRRLVQVRKMGSDPRARVLLKTCRMPNGIREFCLRKARSERFLRTVDLRSCTSTSTVGGQESLPFNSLAVYLDDSSDTELLPLVQKKCDTVKSFMCFNPAPSPYYERVLKSLLSNFSMLKVLKFENVDRGYIGKLPNDIKNLLLLRFLSLRNCHVSQLPSSIGQLTSLQTLDLRTNWRLKLPVGMSKLVNLRHLYLPDITYMNKGKRLCLENLGNLQTLACVSTEYFDLKDLTKLTNLTECRLVVHDAMALARCTMGSFDELESLAVENSSQSRMVLDPFLQSCWRLRKLRIQGQTRRLLLLRALGGLTKLCLKLTRLEDDSMDTFGRLENLKTLVLDCNAFEGDKMVCKNRSFPCLESLSLIKLEKVKEWRVEGAALKNLSYLHINYCYKLKEFPQGLKNADTLKEVVIQRMPMAWLEGGVGHKPHVVFHKITIIDPLD